MLSSEDLMKFRKEYRLNSLNEENISKDPFDQFYRWFDEAKRSNEAFPDAFVFSTCSKDGRPSSRVLLLKSVTNEGFTFFTSYDSAKGKDLDQHPFGSINFFWPTLERQVRVAGQVKKVPAEESEIYFHSRPKGSQLSAYISAQSKSVSSRAEMESKYKEVEEQFKDKDVPLPESWGGYKLIPDYAEFWQGRENRLHDRVVFELKEDKSWSIKRLWP